MRKALFLLLCLFLGPKPAFAQEERAPLAPPYATDPERSTLQFHFQNLTLPEGLFFEKSNTLKVIESMPPIRNQKKRGSCSAFSTVAALEYYLITQKNLPQNIDLSEQWIYFLAVRDSVAEGSTSLRNLLFLRSFGIPNEELWPYTTSIWRNTKRGEAKQRCGYIQEERTQRSCLIGHRDSRLITVDDKDLLTQGSVYYDPEFYTIKEEAKSFRAQYLKDMPPQFIVDNEMQIKNLLQRGIPVIADIHEVYYQAWSHPKSESLHLNRDMERWQKGIVTYPEVGSLDRIRSASLKSGHSIVIVGYDDTKEINYEYQTANGGRAYKTRKGVYYFRNSWGTDDFGSHAQVDGHRTPGYGMITQDYANEFGKFYSLPLDWK